MERENLILRDERSLVLVRQQSAPTVK
jgi:hypothetical protein